MLASVGGVTTAALLGVPLDTISAVSGASGGALLTYVAPAIMALSLHEAQEKGLLERGQEGAALPPPAALLCLGATGVAVAALALSQIAADGAAALQ